MLDTVTSFGSSVLGPAWPVETCGSWQLPHSTKGSGVPRIRRAKSGWRGLIKRLRSCWTTTARREKGLLRAMRGRVTHHRVRY